MQDSFDYKAWVANNKKGDLKETQSVTTGDENLYDDLPAVDMHIDDNGHMSISISAMFHSPDNKKVQVLAQNPQLRDRVINVIRQEAQNLFRKTIHGIAGEPFGLP